MAETIVLALRPVEGAFGYGLYANITKHTGGLAWDGKQRCLTGWVRAGGELCTYRHSGTRYHANEFDRWLRPHGFHLSDVGFARLAGYVHAWEDWHLMAPRDAPEGGR